MPNGNFCYKRLEHRPLPHVAPFIPCCLSVAWALRQLLLVNCLNNPLILCQHPHFFGYWVVLGVNGVDSCTHNTFYPCTQVTCKSIPGSALLVIAAENSGAKLGIRVLPNYKTDFFFKVPKTSWTLIAGAGQPNQEQFCFGCIRLKFVQHVCQEILTVQSENCQNL